MLCWTATLAQQSDTTKTSYLDEVIISANKIAEPKKYVAQQVTIIIPAIKNLNAQTAADFNTNSGQVGMQRSQQGGGSPSSRGFEASRVVLMIDGVRMNDAIYRGGHLQNIITMDNNVLDRAKRYYSARLQPFTEVMPWAVSFIFIAQCKLSTDTN